jgi:hypothetical protein
MNEIPQYLYKYRSLSDMETRKRTFQILEEELIYYPKFHELNDPFDGHVIFKTNITIKDIKTFSEKINPLYPKNPFDYLVFADKKGKVDKPKLKAFCEALPSSRGLLPKYGVLCLSETATNILMWSHYSQYSGIAIEFDTTGSVLNDKGRLLKVHYRQGYPKIKLTDFTPDNDATVLKIFSQKYSNWKYEREWRAITPEGGTIQKIPAKISGIILGPLINPKNEAQIRNIAKSKQWAINKLKESKIAYKLFLEKE